MSDAQLLPEYNIYFRIYFYTPYLAPIGELDHGRRFDVRPRPGNRPYGWTIFPPVIGAGTPVVFGKLMGRPRAVRAAR